MLNFRGMIGLLDELYKGKRITQKEYKDCLNEFLVHSERRLPEDEIQKRIENI